MLQDIFYLSSSSRERAISRTIDNRRLNTNKSSLVLWSIRLVQKLYSFLSETRFVYHYWTGVRCSLPIEGSAKKENKLELVWTQRKFAISNCNGVALFNFMQCPLVANWKAHWSIDREEVQSSLTCQCIMCRWLRAAVWWIQAWGSMNNFGDPLGRAIGH